MATTFRHDLVAALKTTLDAYVVANPTLLRAAYRTRPASVHETPMAYIGGRSESIVHDSGTRTRTFAPTVVIVDVLADNQETGDRMDIVVDALVDIFTANPHAVSGSTLLEQTGVDDVDLDWGGGVIYRAAVLTFARCSIQEGRS